MPQGKTPRNRTLLYAILSPIAALLALEIVLRLAGFHGSAAYLFLLHSHARDVPLLIPDAGDPATLTIHPLAAGAFNPLRIAREKPAGAMRIVCLGGSSVRGVGLPPEDSFPAQLQEKLAAAGQTIEVVNLGGSGLTSEQLIWAAESAAALNPDLAVIYAGHNDWTGARLYRTFTTDRRLLRLRALLAHSRLYLFARHWLLRLTDSPDEPALQPTGGPATRSELAATAAAFRRNLTAVAERLRATGAEVLLATAVSNPFFPPAGFPRPEALREKEEDRDRSGLSEQTIPAILQKLAPVDPQSLTPETRDYIKGLQAWADGNRAAAYSLLDRARDRDPIPLRATSDFRDGLPTTGVTVIDLEKSLQVRFLAGEPVGDLFLDNLHFSRAGASWIAEQLAGAIPKQVARHD